MYIQSGKLETIPKTLPKRQHRKVKIYKNIDKNSEDEVRMKFNECPLEGPDKKKN